MRRRTKLLAVHGPLDGELLPISDEAAVLMIGARSILEARARRTPGVLPEELVRDYMHCYRRSRIGSILVYAGTSWDADVPPPSPSRRLREWRKPKHG